MKKINVLMSTYNGEDYLKTQIDSILDQRDVEVFLTIRDDGSVDKTIDILYNYAELNNVEIIRGNNIGFKESFFTLLYELRKPDFDFYAFSDQDDFWLPQKLKKSVDRVGVSGEPILYIGNRIVADEQLKSLGYRVYDKYPPYDWNASHISRIIDSRGAGCTEVWNARGQLLLEKFRPHNIPHDEWVTGVFTCLGKIVFDENAYILYRRHKHTVSATAIKKRRSSVLDRVNKTFSILAEKKLSQNVDLRCKYLLDGYSRLLSEEDRKYLTYLARYQGRTLIKLKLLLSGRFKVTSKDAPVMYKVQKILMLLTNGL
ncbi:glycosyltransferase [Oenococcus oeni]|uniref:glycosyltransferase n=1 Tax=Oenococcus oeni TaxID=1247 RepID=UPI00050FD8AA|nr:glycosyltransferase [Oenococcus oeni]KGI02459.1 rhamnosyltransferase [Oenococcus oeni IOEB_C52]SYW08478.1 putative Glycosyl transferase family 2 [Oenococcus oeni]